MHVKAEQPNHKAQEQEILNEKHLSVQSDLLVPQLLRHDHCPGDIPCILQAAHLLARSCQPPLAGEDCMRGVFVHGGKLFMAPWAQDMQ